MSDETEASLKLSDRFPDSSVLTDLVSQLKTGVQGVKAPDIATNKIQDLAGSLKLQLPDTSTWKTAIPSDATNLIGNFPDASTLSKPIADPIGKISSAFSFDFSKFQQNQSTQSATAPAPVDVTSMLESLAAPIDQTAKLLADPELARVLTVLSDLTGTPTFQQTGQKVEETAAQVKEILHDKVEGFVLAFVALVTVHSSQELLSSRIAAATGTFSADATQQRLQAVLNQYGGLADMVTSVDAANSGPLRDRLTILSTAFQSYTTNLIRDLAMTEIALAGVSFLDLQKQWEQMKDAVSRVDWSVAGDLSSAITQEVDRIKSKLTVSTGFTLDQYKQSVQSGVGELNTLIGKFDPSTIVQAIQNVVKTILSPLQKIEDLQTQVETIVRGALGTIRDAVEKINLAPLVDSVKQALAVLSGSLKQVSAALDDARNTIQNALNSVKTVLDGVKTFVLDPQDGLKKKIEDVFHSITGVLDELHIQDVMKEVTVALQPVSDALAKIEFQPIIKAVLDAIGVITGILKEVGPLLVTDSLKQKLAEAAAFLQQIDFGKIGDGINATFDEIMASVDQDALGAFQEEYEKVVDTLKNFDPQPALEEVQREVFDPLLDELRQVHPADLLKPIGEAFAQAHEALTRFNPSETFSFMTEFFQNLLAKIDEISPEKLLAPVEKMLDDLKQKIESLLHIDAIVAGFQKFKDWVQPTVSNLDLFAPILEGLSAGHAQMKDAIQSFDLSIFTKFIANLLKGALSKIGVLVNAPGLSAALSAIAKGPGDQSAKLAEMQKWMDDSAARLGALDVQLALSTLRDRHAQVKSAVSARAGAALPDDIGQLITALDPMSVLAPILPKVDRVKKAATAKAAQFSQMVAPLKAVLDGLGNALTLLRSVLSPVTVLRDVLMSPIQGLFPGQTFSGPKELLLHFLDQFNPADLRPSLEPLFSTVEAKLKALIDDAVLGPIGETIQTLKGATDILNIHSLVDAIDGAFKDVENIIRQLDPTPLIQDINSDYQQIVAMLDKLDPSDFIKEIAQIYDADIVGVVQQISPEGLLLPPLRELFQHISSTLGAFNIQAIFKPVLDRLKTLDTDLGGGLHQVETSWQEMLAVLSSTTGEASASASVQVG